MWCDFTHAHVELGPWLIKKVSKADLCLNVLFLLNIVQINVFQYVAEVKAHDQDLSHQLAKVGYYWGLGRKYFHFYIDSFFWHLFWIMVINGKSRASGMCVCVSSVKCISLCSSFQLQQSVQFLFSLTEEGFCTTVFHCVNTYRLSIQWRLRQ